MRRPVAIAAVIVLFVAAVLILALNYPKSTENFQSGTSTAGIVVTNTPVPRLPPKLIEYGWDVPSPAFVRANIKTMEQRPFDGIVNEAHPQQAAGYRSLNTQFRSKLRGIRPTLD
jgi:hypothetical protein